MVARDYSVEAVLTMHDVDAFEEQVSAHPAVTVIRRAAQGPALVADTTAECGPAAAKALMKWSAKRTGSLSRRGITASWLRSWFANGEFKSQVGPSFGNNFNNRIEKAIGSATDAWHAYQHGTFGSVRPWLGYVLLLERAPASRRVVGLGSSTFAVDPVFHNTSYMDRYRIYASGSCASGSMIQRASSRRRRTLSNLSKSLTPNSASPTSSRQSPAELPTSRRYRPSTRSQYNLPAGRV